MAETNDKEVPESSDLGALAISLYKDAVPVVAMSQAVDLPNGMDFGYSQKFFHIADGNLYSIFSPLQGRTYGVKPSFLKKQKYTIEECCGRGRNSVRKGLKFHNFLPSESVTSEVEDGNREEVWKTYAECRLREEHGTKQIMISHWSADGSPPLSVKGKSECSFSRDNENREHENSFLTDSNSQDNIYNMQSENIVPYENENFISTTTPFLTNDTLSKNQILIQVPSHQQDSTSCVKEMHQNEEKSLPVNENLCQKYQNGKQKVSLADLFSGNTELKSTYNFGCSNKNKVEPSTLTKSLQIMENRKHRRKPVQTRRVVPYKKYLSLLEETEDIPLDLSCHSNGPLLVNHTELNTTENGREVKPELPFKKSESLDTNVQNSNCVISHCSSTATTTQNTICTSSTNPFSLPPMTWTTPNHISNDPILNLQEAFRVVKPSRDSVHKSFSTKYKSPVQSNLRQSEVSIASHEQMRCSENTQSFSFCSDKSKLLTRLSSQTKAANLDTNLLRSPLIAESTKQNSRINTSQEINIVASQPLAVAQTYTPVTKSGVFPSETSSHTSKITEHNNTFITNFQLPRPHRKSNQRTIIRQKLEDAFRQNGFLVKTKQVSDGEATFCKFRQLRKYTRYYLKSWHHHLPEEVHKLWKGFLPPKTTLPPVSTGKKGK